MKRGPTSLVSLPAPRVVSRRPVGNAPPQLREVGEAPNDSIADREALSCLRHDLRSLLNSVVGFSELLGSGTYGPLTPAQSTFVDHLRTSAGKLNERFDAFVELSHQEDGGGPRVAVPLFAALHHACDGHTLTITVDEAVKNRPFVVDLRSFRRALERTIALVTAHGAGSLRCHASLEAEGLVLLLDARASTEPPSWFAQIDDVIDEVDSHTLIEVRLAQRLFERQGMSLSLDYSLFAARIVQVR